MSERLSRGPVGAHQVIGIARRAAELAVGVGLRGGLLEVAHADDEVGDLRVVLPDAEDADHRIDDQGRHPRRGDEHVGAAGLADIVLLAGVVQPAVDAVGRQLSAGAVLMPDEVADDGLHVRFERGVAGHFVGDLVGQQLVADVALGPEAQVRGPVRLRCR